MEPTMLLERDRSVSHSSIWLKGVHAVDLSHHCIDSLIGPRIGKDPLRDTSFEVKRLPMDVPAPAYYLCAVAQPYVLEHNAHVLAFLAEGEEHEVVQPGLTVTLFGLRPLAIRAEWITDPARYGHDRYFTTCRNLQAAWWLHQVGGLENRRNDEHDQYRRRATGARRGRQPAGRGLFDDI